MKSATDVKLCFCVGFLLWSWNSELTGATWWWLSVKPPTIRQETRTLGIKEYCNSFPNLTPKQKHICMRHPHLLSKVSEGFRDGIRECQYQMKHRRWNCSTYIDPSDHSTHVFQPILKLRGQERAFIQAIFSAAISHTITRSCTHDKLPQDCGCADQPLPKKGLKWGGCSDDINYGDYVATKFLDDIKRPKSATGRMDLHNNKVGRMTIHSHKHSTCKCHGLSGACTQEICWISLPTMREVGKTLLNYYDKAVEVKIKRNKIKSKTNPRKPKNNELIFIKKSPEFCKRNPKIGSLGTSGRLCDEASANMEGCHYMCCGRPYTTKIVEEEYNCKCIFQYCCKLSCEICTRKVNQSRCT